jgi:hydroxymethylpyrimidine pyrophosphatase-like HAD family hydrolase
MKKLWVFDIDGTLADNEHRMHHLDGKKEWDKFFAKQHLDEPYQPVIDVLHALANDRPGDEVIIVTARDERFREDSLEWLNRHIPWISNDHMYMRPAGDRSDDDKMKVNIIKTWLQRHPNYTVGAIFDDRHRIIDAFRKEGWYTFECNQTRKEF